MFAPMTNERREALWWIGGACLVALLLGGWLFLTAPPFDELATRYSVL
jgi:hypothetical protein